VRKISRLIASDIEDGVNGLHRGRVTESTSSRRGQTWSALSIRNYRLYFSGQVVSVSGTWLQQTALTWTVLKLSGDATDVGVAVALQFLPLLFLGPFGGVIVDRHARRNLLLVTTLLSSALALALTVVSTTGHLTLAAAYAFSLAGGFVTVLDNPSRQAFAADLVPSEILSSAIGLNGVVMNCGRVVGPALAGVLIATVGVTSCFALNAVSYLAVLLALILIRSTELQPQHAIERSRHAFVDGLRFVRRQNEVLIPLLMMAVVGMVTLNFPTLLPVLAKRTFHGNALTFGVLSAVMSVGAIAGAIAAGGVKRPSSRLVAHASVVFGIAVAVCAVAPSLTIEYIVIVPMGAAAYAFVTLAMSAVQIGSDPDVRGRVMALWAVAFAGTTPIGGPAIGAIAQHLGPRVALMVGAVAALSAGLLALPFASPRHASSTEIQRCNSPKG
jgi:MFS family permease